MCKFNISISFVWFLFIYILNLFLFFFLNLGCRICLFMENLEYGFVYGQQYWEGKYILFICDFGYCWNGCFEFCCLVNGIWLGV